ncbi:Barrier to autointegration factor [Popillia japonica]|uniref:Barrier to autointegration factor n=1 Tax=Popillia japonica TaxID=7064 RepID=A0AAW1JEC3_POPJA
MSNTYKHDDFVNEPMRSKRVTDLPGIGETYGDRLHRRGYRNARQVFGEYLAMGGNKREFREFLSETTGANSRQTRDCYEAMRRWDRNFM